MPWLAIPFNDPRVEQFTARHAIEEIPELVIMKNDGMLIDEEAKNSIKLKGSAAFDEWLARK